MTTLNDRWVRIGGIGVLWVLSILTNNLHKQPLTSQTLIRVTLSLVSIAVTWHVIRYLILYFRRKYFSKQDVFKRLLLTFVTGSIASTVILLITGALRHLLLYGTLESYHNTSASITINGLTFALNLYGFDFVQAATTFIFFQSIYETLFFAQNSIQYQKRLKETERERDKLRLAGLQSQLDALKQQVNPHFLFNSLNVLDSLIEDDPRQARLFLEELCTVYRYLLRSNEHYLTDLGTELDFIHSYFHLLKTRHGEGVSLDVAVDGQYQDYRLPPLTLQLLVENAVKHNIVLPDQPLQIVISTDGRGGLTVRNNLQRKSVRVASNGVGLTNILAKYRMLGRPAPTIRETEGEFVVSLPLIAATDKEPV
ncbi:sensor histidine kinase [Larkinella soli]|uniref:sensor histidine kinase n=1 Tax=Larkinella soli TaxID=1770527 RepID=UPI000FFB8388|nr:histidine kinase [Larkinella soli]